jgi:plasmid stabilization system protein ParE
VFHPEAVAEAEAARKWYEARSDTAGEKFAIELRVALERARSAPERWPKYLHGTRRYLLHRFPYLVVYDLGLDAVHVFAIAHGLRRPGYWKPRRR